ncbi:LCP family protein [Streptomyces sp. NBC_01264]|uniref:LCP family protein n=1 Tax=Streptomyces sp. NBC_01264 TaxID=2903804 RepID=UPI0022559C89|nr:LCP family protein [Streptomyces sp. NBC_01264]MCX4781822.1 LCP family protein [Streptomyces sp. NBC_01264]
MSREHRRRAPRSGAGRPARAPLPGQPRRACGRSRRRRLLKAGTLAALVMTLGGGALAYACYEKLDGNITSADLASALGDDRPARSPRGAVNIALIGSDSRAGTGGAYGKGYTSQQSDTLMVLHLSADHRRATVVSLPRDSWVDIPSCDLGDGKTSRPTKAKINSAFAKGSSHGGVAGGAACAIKTVELNTGLHIDHFMEIDFSGLKSMVDALGGVRMCLPQAIHDKKASVSLPAGCQQLDGEQALGFARARYSLGDGSDIGRIGRQQELLTEIFRSVRDKKLDAPAMYRLADAATTSLTVDSELGGLSGLLGLAQDFRAMPEGGLTFVTVPNQPRSLEVPADKANVVWKPAAAELFAALREDRPVDGAGKPLVGSGTGARDAGGATAAVRAATEVAVLNGSDETGKAAGIAPKVTAAGFGKVTTGNTAAPEPATVIRYGPGGEPAARALADALNLDPSRLRPASAGAPGTGLTLVIGADHSSAGL